MVSQRQSVHPMTGRQSTNTRGVPLQKQGVPIPSRLGKKSNYKPVRHTVYEQTRTPTGYATTRTTYEDPRARRNRRSAGRGPSSLIPGSMADQPISGVGLLEAEFLIGVGLLILLLFASSNTSLGERILSFMKRGTLLCLMFFILAMLSTIGPTASKITKAFGALVLLAMLMVSPMITVTKDIDNLIKNQWVGSTEHGTDTADSGTSKNTSGTSGVGSTIWDGIKNAAEYADGQKGILHDIANAIVGFFHL